jgi:DNA polymerase
MTSLRELAAEAASCTRCDLYRHASRTVFGEGRARASLVLVGEQPRGKRRIHQRPSGSEIRACRHWLEAELTVIRPQVLVAMGATAGVSLFGSRFRVGEHGVQVEELTAGSWQGLVVSTIHPSAVLRAPDEDARHDAYAGFVSDLAIAGKAAARAA